MRDVRFLHAYEDVFHAGKNFGKKLLPHNVQGLKIQWDPKEKWFEMTYNGRKGWIFPTNCAFWEEELKLVTDPVNEHKTESIQGRIEAQVSTPMGHVFEGLGKGKTGRAGK